MKYRPDCYKKWPKPREFNKKEKSLGKKADNGITSKNFKLLLQKDYKYITFTQYILKDNIKHCKM